MTDLRCHYCGSFALAEAGQEVRCKDCGLCGTMFGLQTPDGRAELRRHRLFETSWPIALRPACQHGHVGVESLTVTGTGMGPGNKRAKRETLSVVGQKGNGWTGRGEGTGMALREIFSTDDARHAMGIDWMSMRDLSQAIPPVYARWIGERALEEIRHR